MTTIGSIGIGLFVLIILWCLALILFVIAVRNQSNFGWFVVGIALIITIILITIPTEKQEQPLEDFVVTVSTVLIFFSGTTNILIFQEKDYSYIYRTLLLTFVLLSALIGFVAFFILQCIEPIRAKTVKAF